MDLFKRNLPKILGIILIIGLFAILYKIYIPRINAFGCFDDCFNFLGGYFLTQGKDIYTDFFYNHQPGMAYLSMAIQSISTPDSIPELILSHRQFIFLFSLFSTILLFLRFGYPILLTSLIYESFKFYVFGDRFLAESIVGYLIVYMVGVIIECLHKKFLRIDSYLLPLTASLVILLREPFIPVAMFLFSFYLYLIAKQKRAIILPILLFIVPLTIYFTYNFSDYYLNLVTVNKLVITSSPSETPFLIELLKSFFYPFFIVFSPQQYNFFRTVLTISIVSFISLLLYFSLRKKGLGIIIFIIVVLFLTNLRPVSANQTFFEAFHIAPWFLLLLYILFYLGKVLFNKIKIRLIAFALFGVIFLTLFFNKEHFVNNKVDTNSEYFTNFSHVMDIGTTIRNLSDSKDTLFVDGYDDLIIWEAKLKGNYKYSWYTSYMPKIEMYSAERNRMIINNPPDFYYGQCLATLKELDDPASAYLYSNFLQLSPINSKSCILISKKRAESLGAEKILKLKGTKYENFKIPGKQPKA